LTPTTLGVRDCRRDRAGITIDCKLMKNPTEIGCCGAYCGTCPELLERRCPGCRLGYESGARDLAKARCRMKVCCINRLGLGHTCGDCPDYSSCDVIQGFYGKKGYKYRKYRESMEFIRARGCEAFMEAAKDWRRAYGRSPGSV
jgi:hypothetical protein